MVHEALLRDPEDQCTYALVWLSDDQAYTEQQMKDVVQWLSLVKVSIIAQSTNG